jgi:hypothetical protein
VHVKKHVKKVKATYQGYRGCLGSRPLPLIQAFLFNLDHPTALSRAASIPGICPATSIARSTLFTGSPAMPNPFQANPSPPPSSHSSSSRPTLSAPSWFSHIDPKRAGRSLLPFVLVLAAGSVLVLASYGGMESFAGMGVGSIDVNSEEIEVVKSPEEHPIFELMRNGEKK